MLDYIKDLALRAGEIMHRKFEIFDKDSPGDRNDIVTSADIEVERFLIENFKREYHSYDIFSEETENQPTGSDHVWVIDPIDGTKNFTHGLPMSSISIGLLREGLPVLGVIYNPIVDDMYWAEQGGGAWKNDRPIHASLNGMPQSIILIEGSSVFEKNRQYPKKLDRIVLATRHLGCASLNLAYIAEGIVDAYVDEDLKCYDIAAGAVIIQEAGGMITGLNGAPLFPRQLDYADIYTAASNRTVHQEFLEILNQG